MFLKCFHLNIVRYLSINPGLTLLAGYEIPAPDQIKNPDWKYGKKYNTKEPLATAGDII